MGKDSQIMKFVANSEIEKRINSIIHLEKDTSIEIAKNKSKEFELEL